MTGQQESLVGERRAKHSYAVWAHRIHELRNEQNWVVVGEGVSAKGDGLLKGLNVLSSQKTEKRPK